MSTLPSAHDQTTTASTSVSDDRNFVSQDATRNTARDDADVITTATSRTQPHEGSALDASQQPRGSLSLTPAPLQDSSTEIGTKKETGITSSVGTQNAPGRAGSIGEAALGALGYGGTAVERPKEDQGLGEKIVNFLGA